MWAAQSKQNSSYMFVIVCTVLSHQILEEFIGFSAAYFKNVS